MKTIYKYPLAITDSQVLEIPNGFELIHAGLDPQGVPCVWATVYPGNDINSVTIYIFGTGEQITPAPQARKHIGSFVNKAFVWHVFH